MQRLQPQLPPPKPYVTVRLAWKAKKAASAVKEMEETADAVSVVAAAMTEVVSVANVVQNALSAQQPKGARHAKLDVKVDAKVVETTRAVSAVVVVATNAAAIVQTAHRVKTTLTTAQRQQIPPQLRMAHPTKDLLHANHAKVAAVSAAVVAVGSAQSAKSAAIKARA